MRIAQIAPLYESVPPKTYGGTERVVSYLTEELVRTGHDVTLFASGDSVTAAELVPVSTRSLRLDQNSIDALAQHVLRLLFQQIDVDDLEVLVDPFAGDGECLSADLLRHLRLGWPSHRQRGCRGDTCAGQLQHVSS